MTAETQRIQVLARERTSQDLRPVLPGHVLSVADQWKSKVKVFSCVPGRG